MHRDGRRWLTIFTAAAFVLRLIAGLARGPGFVGDGYAFYAEIARTFWDGNGVCYAPDDGCAVRVPLYPVLIAPFLATGTAFPWLIAVKAAIGAMQPLLAYGLGSLLFNRRVAMAAAAGAAFNPYAIAHGPSLQDTVVFNALITLAVLLLLHAARRDDPAASLGAGLALALATLTTVRMVLFVPIAIGWVMFARPGVGLRTRAMKTGCVVLPLALLLGAWATRNAHVVGAPVLTTEFGLSLWLAHNPDTMAFLPGRSIDLVEASAWRHVSQDQRRLIASLGGDDVAEDRYYATLAIGYVVANPRETAWRALQKVASSFVGWLSPAREWPVQIGYLAIYGPLHVLGLAGLWRQRRAGRDHALIALMVIAFAITTAVFWAHTSHRSFLHVFMIVYAASLIRVRTGAYGA
jgi:4-amino-4-deoxy-L-arabinose transferase-like glycosyltransferase